MGILKYTVEELVEIRSEEKRQQQLINYITAKTGCWLWLGTLDKDGYGKLKRYGKNIRAHRFFYETHIGPIEEGKLICHSCDNPRCVNPEHLFQGTNLDNEKDKDSKGRRRNGWPSMEINNHG